MGLTRDCPYCGISYEYDINRFNHGRQTTCSRKCSYAYRAENRRKPAEEKFDVKEYNRLYYISHQEEIKASVRDYAKKNRNKLKATSKAYRLANRDRNISRSKTWYYEHKQTVIEKSKAWKKQNIEKVRANTRSYASRRRNATGSFSSKDYIKLLNRFNRMCAYCGINEANSIDHVTPISKGGSNYIGNILPACGSCNYSKRDKNLYKWKATNGRILTI